MVADQCLYRKGDGDDEIIVGLVIQRFPWSIEAVGVLEHEMILERVRYLEVRRSQDTRER